MLIYMLCFAVSLGWYFGMQPSNDRIWHDEVAQLVKFDKQGDIVTLQNVRNFTWHNKKDYEVRWETRSYDLKDLESFELILSDWGLDKIVHTMASFSFKNGEKLSFSLEIRKESHEKFSAIGGFFASLSLGLSWVIKKISYIVALMCVARMCISIL